ncbi:MAG: mannose-1-phosphate guanylyltransferase/mannose-6-phosphate isomerase [Nitrospirae bacterium]|nr:mannose-1-phosphate guanylyltransferase/mannose-6-phosphate isomerase [Nitrospirota bacterium]
MPKSQSKLKSPNTGLYAVIMAGGSGTRFWPLSRQLSPKQLLRIDSDDSLIQQTVKRICSLVPSNRVHIVTNENHYLEMKMQLALLKEKSESRIQKSEVNFLIEPEGRNTAAAIGLAAISLFKKDPNSLMLVMPADHIIKKSEKFMDIVKDAVDAAKKGYLVTFGIKPDRPETGYGYIKTGSRVKGQGIFMVERFTEKPDVNTAQKYLMSGDYLWNSGIFLWKSSVILNEIKNYLPDLYKNLMDVKKTIGSNGFDAAVKSAYSKIKPISIDYGILEKSKKVTVIPADIDWCDVGSWSALDEVVEKDKDGNIKMGNVIDIGSGNSILYGGKRVLATIGLKDLVVVDTDDATLVCKKTEAQKVGKIVEELKRRGSEAHLTHKTVYRPWGAYTVLETGERFKIKRIEVKPKAKLSLQMHHHRSEHWVVVSGTARVTNGDKVYNVHTNESTYIPPSTRHRLENPGIVPLHIIEVQSGEYLEEDDIVRFDDDYERIKKSI